MLIVYNYGQIYYVDPDDVDELKNFRDVFLSSLALEGITLSMVSWEMQSIITTMQVLD